MSSKLLSIFLASAATIGAAQDVGVFNQGFQLRYNSWRLNQFPATSTTLAVYDFTAGLPVVSYRLGALALTGSMEYNRLSVGESSGSDLGLNRYGIRINLFPYRPFHLNLNYSHSQTPALLGSDRVKGDVFGAAMMYRGRKVQDLQFSFRRGTSSQLGDKETWTLWNLGGNQRYGDTFASFQVVRQEFDDSGGGLGWKNNSLWTRTDTALSKEWQFRTTLTADEGTGVHRLGANADLVGARGPWVSLSSLTVNETSFDSQKQRSFLLSESASYSTKRITTFGSVALSTLSAPSGSSGSGVSSQTGTLLLGGAYSLTNEWRLFGDLSLSTSTRLQTEFSPSRDTTTLHAGVIRGGDVPDLIKHTLFYLSDLSFQRRIQNDYPPNHVSGELAAEMIQRRIRQNGRLGFTGEIWHVQANGGEGKLDWAKITGDLKVGGNLQFLTIADWKRDDGLHQLGVRSEDQSLSLNGSYRFQISSLSASAGYYRNSRRVGTLGTSVGPGALQSPENSIRGNIDDRASTFYSIGFNSRLWKVPYGVLWTKYDAGQDVPTTAISSYATLNFRRVSLRVTYEIARRPNGFLNSRISVDLLRFFDSIAFWGPRH